MGNFCQFLTELLAKETSIFSFQDNNLNKSQWIFTKLDMCINIVEIRFRIANVQILLIFNRDICPRKDNGEVLAFHILIFPRKQDLTFRANCLHLRQFA